jgi:hypothetical protein
MESLSKDLLTGPCLVAEKSSTMYYSSKIHFNITRPSTTSSSKWFLSSSFTEYNSALIFQLPMNATAILIIFNNV